jgi:hypothetical protein
MTYRDDLDAAQARADALAREVEELRRKNAALEVREAEDARTREARACAQRLALAELRERAEQAQRDAVRARAAADAAQRAAQNAQKGKALVPTGETSPRDKAIGHLVVSLIAIVVSAASGHGAVALLFVGMAMLAGLMLMLSARP